ncbi:MAG: PA2779 family protein [Steroidobacteraceae bacterium]
MMHLRSKQAAVALVSLLLIAGGLPRTTRAAIIDTQTVLAAHARGESLQRIDRVLQQDELRARLAKLGVERGAIDARLAALTDAELASFAERLESAPAGGDALGVIGIVFLVLVILELVGVIDIFKTVGPPRR